MPTANVWLGLLIALCGGACGSTAEVTGNPPGHHPFAWDVMFAAAERLGGERRSRAIVLYNNRPDTNAADVVALLEGVRAHIEEELARSLQPADAP